MADVSNQSDCIVKKNLHSEMKGVQEKDSIIGVRAKQKTLSLAIKVRHHSASHVMPDDGPCDGFFYLPIIPMIDHYIF